MVSPSVGCTLGGDIFKFVMQSRGLNFQEAAQELAESCGITIQKVSQKERKQMSKKQSLYQLCTDASNYFISNLWIGSAGESARDYLFKRELKEETSTKEEITGSAAEVGGAASTGAGDGATCDFQFMLRKLIRKLNAQVVENCFICPRVGSSIGIII